MCEPNVREDTNRTIARNQRDSVARYFELVEAVRSIGCNTPIMPVLQGWEPEDYTAHLICTARNGEISTMIWHADLTDGSDQLRYQSDSD